MNWLSRREALTRIVGGFCVGAYAFWREGLSTTFFSDVKKSVLPAIGLGEPLEWRTDKIDLDLAYLLYESPDRRHNINLRTHDFLRTTIKNLDVPKHGMIVELGSYRAQSLKVLCEVFGEGRCLGYDAYPYAEHAKLRIKDVRDFNSGDNMPIALGWNDVSTWKSSPLSKMSAHNYLKSNIVKGGLLVEDALSMIPQDVDFSGFELVFDNEDFSVFRKV